ncbi:MAG: sigma 54-interacting transcriptional regulator [Deltaproteobacteria bacterium]|nr:sigma 54-interacting transcriptional regulator [Deltaproteobacteria bacterium]
MDLSKYWKTIVDTLQDGVMVVDPNGLIIAVNPAAERLTGYTAKELVGHSCRMLDCTGCEIYARGQAEKWCGLFAKGDVRVKECSIINRDKRSVSVIKNATILYDESNRVIGAVETLTDMSTLVSQQFEISRLRRSLHMDDGFHGLIGKSPVMQNLYELVENVAQSEAPVMISGESGTGKELVARAIHEASDRKKMPFIKVNCSALNENLLESELFGHVKGAYTGAEKARVGRFEAAHGGTIFLDEIGDISPAIQVKLLRILEEREIERVGDHQPIKVDVRVVTATNKDLEALTEKGLFRNDLFFRINVFPIHCPSLKKRVEDIPMIVQHFIRINNEKSGKKILGMTPEAIEKITAYPWPGNVRELRNTIEYAFVLCPSGGIGVNHLPAKIVGAEPERIAPRMDRGHPAQGALAAHTHPNPEPPAEKPAMKKSAAAKKEALIDALRQTRGRRSEAAQLLGVSRVTVWKWIRRFGIDLINDLAEK